MESDLSGLSSLSSETKQLYIEPHYKESYRLAIYALLCGGREAYEAFLCAEHISHFLSEEEIDFILQNAQLPAEEDESDARGAPADVHSSTYFPTESDDEVPNLDLGWQVVNGDATETSISLLFHPARHNTPTIKEAIRKHIQNAKQTVAVVMDVFTDVDIFKEMVSASLRGVVVYILLDDSHFKSFYHMSQRVGVNIQDLKNMRVRTVEGVRYQCQSGMKFHGGMVQRFLLVDCSVALYGSYSYTWAYEKLNRSMALVITGQLLGSYDEQFRMLYAISTVPALLSREPSSVHYLRNGAGMQRPSCSHLSLQQIHPQALHGMRTAPANAATMTRGRSVQEQLHQSHSPDRGGLLRGYSYGGDLQKTNSMTRLKMGTKDIGSHSPLGRSVAHMRGDGDLLAAKRLQQIRHFKRYGHDQNMIPFNSDLSLHRWKIDAYLGGGDMPVDASNGRMSPRTLGLNDYPSQAVYRKSREIKTRIEERQHKRLSLQEFLHLRKSQESLRSMYSTLERPVHMSSMRSLDMRQSLAEFVPNGHSLMNHDPTSHQGPHRESGRWEPAASYGHNSENTRMTHDWQEPRMTSTADLDTILDDPSLKLSFLQSNSLSLQHPRAMESLTKIPEEKESSNTHVKSLDSSAHSVKREHDESVPKENVFTESCHQDQTKTGRGPLAEGDDSLVSAAQRERNKSVSSDTEQAQPDVVTKTSRPETQQEERKIQRKSSMRMKVQSMFSSDEKKAAKKEERSLQKASINGLHSTVGRTTEAGKQKSPFPRLASYRSSKRKTKLAAEQEHGSMSSLDSEATTGSHTATDKVYSRYELLLSGDKSSSLKRHDSGHQAQSGTDRKLGRFMQRMGNLISKNKQN